MVEDNAKLFMEWTTLYAMVMKLQKIPVTNGDPIEAAKHIVDAYGRYLKSRGIAKKSYSSVEFENNLLTKKQDRL